MRSLSEWLMREMQDRLAELRGMTGRTNPYPYPPREEQMGHAQSHHGVSGTGSVPPIPGTPWSAAWYPPPPGSAYTTPTSATLYSSTPYQGPFMPRPSWLTQQSPYVPPGPFIPEFGEFTAPQRPGTSQGNDELAPSFGSRYISSPVVTKLSPPASKPALDSEPTSSTAQAASNGASFCSQCTCIHSVL
ncbi:hypothetical protein OG21DRAFT_782919 [Imleria badia]|nr:hypothetical protein OG21DRAFT_782919 [Imleria badia]